MQIDALKCSEIFEDILYVSVYLNSPDISKYRKRKVLLE